MTPISCRQPRHFIHFPMIVIKNDDEFLYTSTSLPKYTWSPLCQRVPPHIPIPVRHLVSRCPFRVKLFLYPRFGTFLLHFSSHLPRQGLVLCKVLQQTHSIHKPRGGALLCYRNLLDLRLRKASKEAGFAPGRFSYTLASSSRNAWPCEKNEGAWNGASLTGLTT